MALHRRRSQVESVCLYKQSLILFLIFHFTAIIASFFPLKALPPLLFEINQIDLNSQLSSKHPLKTDWSIKKRESLQDMDTSNPAVFVNAEKLQMYVGKKVRTVIQVIRAEGGVVYGKSTDDHQLVIKGNPPPSPLSSFVEVIGTAESNQSIHADIWTNFGDTFDMHNYNQLCQLANGEFKHLFL